MKYILIIGFIFCLGCKKQKSNFVENNHAPTKTAFFKTKKIPSILDSLETEEAIQSFVQKLEYPFIRYREHDDSIRIYKGLEKFELKKIKDFDRSHDKDVDSLTKKLADSLNINKSFYKGDVDNNGYTDLVIIGDDMGCIGFQPGEPNSKRSCDYSVYALMNFGNDSINPVDLVRSHYTGEAIVPKMNETNGRTTIVIFETPRYSWLENKKISGVKKTELTYKSGAFVEYNHHPIEYKIEKIEFEAGGCFGSCPIFELTINNDRTASLNTIEFNSLEANLSEYEITQELKGQFKTVIDKESYKELIELLNYLDFPTLEDYYSVSATDNPECKLTITYNQGKNKTITDYGKIGTLGLKRIYQLVSNFKTNQKWK